VDEEEVMAEEAQSSAAYLTLGWAVTGSMEPRYWQQADATPGGQAAEDLFRVRAVDMASHTAIIAQSGSGKSFFLGRLIEELLLNSKARCVVLDPNADFRRVAEVVEDAWTVGGRSQGLYTHEASREEFTATWGRVGIIVRSGWARASQPGEPRPQQVPLELWWPSIPAQFLAQDLEPVQRGEVSYCHKTADLLGFLLEYKAIDHHEGLNLLDEAEDLFHRARSMSAGELESYVEAAYGLTGITGRPYETRQADLLTFETDKRISVVASSLKAKTDALAKRVAGIRKWVSRDVEQFYLAKAREYQSSGILQDTARSPEARWPNDVRLEVIDLPSLDEFLRREAVYAILDREWSRARAAWETAMLPLHDEGG
jgi:hypothetical protein